MTAGPRSRARLAGAAMVLVVVTAIAFAVNVFSASGVERINRAQVWSALLAAAAVIGPAVGWAIRQSRPVSSGVEADRERRAGDHLAARTRALWALEARARGLDPRAPGLVSRTMDAEPFWSGATATAGRAAVVRGQGQEWFEELYQDLRAGDSLVVLGPAGSGKTASLLVLLLEALHRREHLPDDQRALMPVPVLITCGSWDPSVTTLPEHVADALAIGFPGLTSSGLGGPETAAQLVADGRVAVFLDGLDEMPPALQPTALAAISTQATGLIVVLSSRTDVYRTVVSGVRSRLSRVVELGGVDVDTAATFLHRDQTRERTAAWAPVVARLRADPDGPLAQALAGPLGLTLARDTYLDADPADLLDPGHRTVEAVRAHLFGAFLDQAYPAVTQAERDERDRVLAQLSWIAREMRGERDLAWWDLPNWVPDRLMRVTAGAIVGVAGLLTGLPVGLGIGVRDGAALGVRVGLIVGALLGTVCALVLGAMLMPSRPAHYLVLRAPRPGEAARLLVIAVIAAPFLLAIQTAAAAELTGSENPFLLAVLAAPGLIGAMALALLDLWRVPAEGSEEMTPLRSYRGDVRSSRVRTLAVAMSAGPVLGPILGVALGVVGEHPAPRLMLAQAVQRLRGQGRVRYLQLLEDARDRQVLRQAGVVYQFRHAELQDYLARRRA